MPRPPTPVLLACLLAAVSGLAAVSAQNVPDYRLAQLTIQQRVLVRIQRAYVAPAAIPGTPAKPLRWTEKKGPRCLPLDGLVGAMIVQPDAVDLIARGGLRYRVRLEDDCPSLDFYRDFYFKPTADGKICADRDALRSRSGRMCGIDRFRRLVVKR